MKNYNLISTVPKFVLCDIDDTLTNEGELHGEAYQSLWDLTEAGLHIIPITGRPAGWCEMIARVWPVAGVVGENGGFFFRYDKNLKKMKRSFVFDFDEQALNRKKLEVIQEQVLREVPGSAIASDQFCRLMDLAIDFCEDVPPLHPNQIQKIVNIFTAHGAQAKVSSIHVNGWFGTYNKLQKTLEFLSTEFNCSEQEAQKTCVFAGDSPNDEPMFEFFDNSVAVANFKKFADQVKHQPKFITDLEGGYGFAELSRHLLKLKES